MNFFKLIILAILIVILTVSVFHLILLNEIEEYSENVKYKTLDVRDKVFPTALKWSFDVNSADNRSDGFSQVSSDFKSISKNEVFLSNVYEEIKFDNPDGGVWKQGWDVRYQNSDFDNEKLRVFVVPHSHNDPGWLKTFDKYFREKTKRILDNLIAKLTQNKQMTFIWSEVSYLSAWWETTTSDELKIRMKKLLDSGQLEITTGGWVMNDEANTHYFAMISQMIEGHEWLMTNLNYKPINGWAIDPFGLSPTMAFLLKRMGLEAMVIQRVHYSIKKYLAQHKVLEFRWRQFWEQHAKGDILCHVEPFFSYDIPHTCGPDPKVCCQFDFKRLPPTRIKCPWKVNPQTITGNNVKARAEILLDQYRKKSMLFQTKSLLVPLGDDFRYDEGREWDNQFNNYIKLFNYLNSNPDLNIEIKFATLKDYFDSLENKAQFPSLVGDFFTYSDRDDHYWSGFYTSKPFYKRFDRFLESHLRSAEIIYSFALLHRPESSQLSSLSPLLTYARQNLALFQHHDGITGTAKEDVVVDYANRMLQSLNNLEIIITNSTKQLLKYDTKNNSIELLEKFVKIDIPTTKTMVRLNRKTSSRYILVFNSLGQAREELICLKVKSDSNNLCVQNSDGEEMNVQVNYVWIKNTPLENTFELCFIAHLDAMSLQQFKIFECDGESSKLSQTTLYHYDEVSIKNIIYGNEVSKIAIENDEMKLIFSLNKGMLEEVNIKNEKGSWNGYKMEMSLKTYGTRSGKKVQKSGAYLFLPDKNNPQELAFNQPKIRIIEGPIVNRLEFVVEDPVNFYHRVSLIKGKKYFEIENEFDIAKDSFGNQELLMRFDMDVQNEDLFYTDLNAFQMIKRKRYSKIPIQGNVYPMPSLSYFQDNKTRVNILSGQPLGVTSQKSGQIDIFLDRRLLQDDQRGLNQGVVDNKLTREYFKVIFETTPREELKPSLKVQNEVHRLLYPPISMLSSSRSRNSRVNFFQKPLPCNIHLVNLRKVPSNDKFSLFLHRLGLSGKNSCSYNLNLSETFSPAIKSRIQNYVDKMSLSLLSVENRNISIHDNLFIDEMDLSVFTIVKNDNY